MNEYNKVKKIFKKPKLRIYFGFWDISIIGQLFCKYHYKHYFNDNKEHKCFNWFLNLFTRADCALPVWRRGNAIKLFKKHCRYNRKNCNYEWDDEFKRKLNKHHLSWLKPYYELPSFLSFHIFKWDVFWKMKYESPRYEFPPQFTIVLFNISLTLTWHNPYKPKNVLYDNDYWESVLTYLYCTDKNLSIRERIIRTGDMLGSWKTLDENDSSFVLKFEYLKDPFANQLNRYREEKYHEIQAQKKEKNEYQ